MLNEPMIEEMEQAQVEAAQDRRTAGCGTGESAEDVKTRKRRKSRYEVEQERAGKLLFAGRYMTHAEIFEKVIESKPFRSTRWTIQPEGYALITGDGLHMRLALDEDGAKFINRERARAAELEYREKRAKSVR